MKKILTVMLTVLFVVSGLLPVVNPAKVEAASKPTTIFLHGWRGDQFAMAPLIKEISGEKDTFNQEVPYQMVYYGKKKVFSEVVPYAGQGTTYFFSPPGGGKSSMQIINFKKSGSVVPNKQLVHVVFTENIQNLNEQERFLREVMADLKKKNVKKVNLVGHSMGGLLATQLLLKGSPIPVEKVVTLDSPIFGSPLAPGGDLKDGGKVVRESKLKKKKISSTTKVLSYGLKYPVIVLINSSNGLSKFTNKNQFTYKQVNTSHKGIKSNATVLKEVAKFLK